MAVPLRLARTALFTTFPRPAAASSSSSCPFPSLTKTSYKHICLHLHLHPKRNLRPFTKLTRPLSSSSSVEDAGSVSSTSILTEPTPLPPQSSADPLREAADALDIRVGRVLKAWRHPEADSLYVEEVDIGEPEPRTICSGLVEYVPLEDLQEKHVVVLANLKPRNMRGVKSNGMLLAASDEKHENVELLVPPEGSVPGERVWFGSEEDRNDQSEVATPNQVQKKKLWEFVQPNLGTTSSCVAVLKENPMRTSAGVVTCKSLNNARIS